MLVDISAGSLSKDKRGRCKLFENNKIQSDLFFVYLTSVPKVYQKYAESEEILTFAILFC